MSIIRTVMRILTPEEINTLVNASFDADKYNLTEMLMVRMGKMDPKLLETEKEKKEREKLKENTDNILPFKKNDDEEDAGEILDEVEEIPIEYSDAGLKVSALLKGFYDQYFAIKDDPMAPKRRPRKAPQTKKETSLFILDEKRKMRNSLQALKKQELHGIYQKNQDAGQEASASSEDLSKSTKIGVLVNKKQA